MTNQPVSSETTFEFDQERHIVVAQKVYEREALSDEVRNAISHINHADQQLATMDANLRIFKVGRDGMVQMLVERLDQDGSQPVAVVPDQEPAQQPVEALE